MSMGLFDMISKRHLTRRPYCAALVPAAGKSERMGGTDKLTAQLGGIPVLERTLLALDGASLVDEIVVAVSPERLEELLYAMAALPGIRVRGLMTVPPILTAPEEQRRVFSQMYKLFIDIRGKNIDNIRMDMLSMGMSSDYEQAILEGSTLVRIGSALFGRRL